MNKWQKAQKIESDLERIGYQVLQRTSKNGNSIYLHVSFYDEYIATVRFSNHKSNKNGGFNKGLNRRMGDVDFDVYPGSKVEWRNIVSEIKEMCQ